jgi:hypothetical protein
MAWNEVKYTVGYLIMHIVCSQILLCIMRSYALLDHHLAEGWEVGAVKDYALQGIMLWIMR